MKKTMLFVKGYLFLKFLSHLSHSYLEPGSSSFLLKIIISSLAGIALFFKHIWAIIKPLYLQLFSKKPVQVAKPVDEGNPDPQ